MVVIMCVWQELPGSRSRLNLKTLSKFYYSGYDSEYTETNRKDIQNLAQEIETKYTEYGI